jgi:hypothetical protein
MRQAGGCVIRFARLEHPASHVQLDDYPKLSIFVSCVIWNLARLRGGRRNHRSFRVLCRWLTESAQSALPSGSREASPRRFIR